MEAERKFNPNEWVPPVMAIGTWLFAMHQQYLGIHWIPDDWIVGIILSPYGVKVYSLIRTRMGDAIKLLPKKD